MANGKSSYNGDIQIDARIEDVNKRPLDRQKFGVHNTRALANFLLELESFGAKIFEAFTMFKMSKGEERSWFEN